MKTRLLSVLVSLSLILVMCSMNAAENSPSVTNSVQAEQAVSSSAKEKMLLALIDFLKLSKETLQDGVEVAKAGAVEAGKFAKVQIPFVLQELIVLRRAEVTAHFLALVAITYVVHWVSSELWRGAKHCESKTDSDACITFSIFFRIFGVIIPVLIFCLNVRGWCLPWFAPRVYLIEYTVKLIEKIT